MNYSSADSNNDDSGDSLLTSNEKEEFAGIMLVDKVLGVLTMSAVLAVSIFYWVIFFKVAVKIEPMIYSYFGVGQ